MRAQNPDANRDANMDMPVQQQTILALTCGLPTVMSESLAQATDGFSDPGYKT